MKNYIKRMTAAVLSGILILSGSVSALAAGPETGGATFRGRNAAPRFPVVASVYNAIDGEQVPDLFGEVTKNLSPGSDVEFTVKLSNDSDETVRFGMKATLVEQDKANKIAALADYSDKSAVKHSELLNLISIEITRHTGGDVLYSGTLGGLAADTALYSEAGLSNIIGAVTSGNSGYIDVAVSVPVTLGNEYQNALTAVDWVFTVEADDPETPVFYPQVPGTVINDEIVPDIVPDEDIVDTEPPLAEPPVLDEEVDIPDEDVPLADFEVDIPKTGDDSGMLGFGLVAGVALVGLLGLLVYSFKSKKDEPDPAE
jgi:LPXTG-motif cell wall-anchored protein